ncbi:MULTISPECIES: Rieske 2Fe-2S domain-containing protein [unclassified Variovorax]|uniref:Rieske 2Fe-2S domain-containing protein n=1 Tax=unclassified Variovorax TaxID=663243 RepID=UPI0032E79CB4
MTVLLKQAEIETDAPPTGPMQVPDAATPLRARPPMVAHMRCLPGDARAVLPYANGWFVACFSHELQRGAVLIKSMMDRDIVLYRTQSGLARVVEPYCPHMGAHLGHGGRVEGENLVCPFHHLQFGPEGGCVHTGRAGAVPRMALTARHMRERNGVIFVWVHHEGLAPSREPPTHDLTGWSRPAYVHHEQGGYFQNSGKNSVDLIHFDTVHHFQQPEMSADIVDNCLVVRLSARLLGRPICLHLTNYDASNLYGHFTMPSLGLEAGVQGYSTPDTPLRWSLRMVTAMKVERFARWPAGIQSLLYALMTPLAGLWSDRTSHQDTKIWEHRGHTGSLKLMADERAAALYQRWVSQFYSCGFPGVTPSAMDRPSHKESR